MYTTMVLIVSNIVRGYFTGIFNTIMYDDMPNVDRILQVRFTLICERALYSLASTVQHGDNSSSVRHAKQRSMAIVFLNAAWPATLQKYMFMSWLLWLSYVLNVEHFSPLYLMLFATTKSGRSRGEDVRFYITVQAIELR